MKDNKGIPISVSLIEVSGSAQYLVSFAAVFVSSRNAPPHYVRDKTVREECVSNVSSRLLGRSVVWRD